MSALLRYVRRHHLGLIALFIALGGTAYAATAVPPNSVGTRQLRRHAVALSKIDPGAARALRGRRGPSGRAGERGPSGLAGPTGPIGPSDSYYSAATPGNLAPHPDGGVSVTVPPGNYTATGGCTALYEAPVGTSLAFNIAESASLQGLRRFPRAPADPETARSRLV